jgi:hypothetical protein
MYYLLTDFSNATVALQPTFFGATNDSTGPRAMFATVACDNVAKLTFSVKEKKFIKIIKKNSVLYDLRIRMCLPTIPIMQFGNSIYRKILQLFF